MTVVPVLAYDLHVHVHDGVVLTSVTPHVIPFCVHVSYQYLNDNRVTYLKTVHACVVYTWTFCSHCMHINKHSWYVNT